MPATADVSMVQQTMSQCRAESAPDRVLLHTHPAGESGLLTWRRVVAPTKGSSRCAHLLRPSDYPSTSDFSCTLASRVSRQHVVVHVVPVSSPRFSPFYEAYVSGNSSLVTRWIRESRQYVAFVSP